MHVHRRGHAGVASSIRPVREAADHGLRWVARNARLTRGGGTEQEDRPAAIRHEPHVHARAAQALHARIVPRHRHPTRATRAPWRSPPAARTPSSLRVAVRGRRNELRPYTSGEHEPDANDERVAGAGAWARPCVPANHPVRGTRSRRGSIHRTRPERRSRGRRRARSGRRSARAQRLARLREPDTPTNPASLATGAHRHRLTEPPPSTVQLCYRTPVPGRESSR